MLGKADTRSGDKDGKVQLAELQSYVNSEVTYQARRRYSRDQTPEILGNPEFVLSILTDASFLGFGDPDAVGQTPQQRVATPQPVQPSPVSPPPATTQEEGFSLFGIKITPKNEQKMDR